MLSTLQLWARYNQRTNETVNKLLTALGTEAYAADRPGFFKSLQAVHVHIIEVMGIYLGLLRRNTGNPALESAVTAEDYQVKLTTLEEAIAHCVEFDRLLLAFANATTEAQLAGPRFRRTVRSGKTFLISPGDLLLQYMNHTAHHRGQLSQMLDELGVEHDIGGLMAYMEEVTP